MIMELYSCCNVRLLQRYSSLHELASAIILRRTKLFISQACLCNYSAKDKTLHCTSLPVQLFGKKQYSSLHEFASAIILRRTKLFIARAWQCNYSARNNTLHCMSLPVKLFCKGQYSSIFM